MPERGGESSDRGWRYAIFFFSAAVRRVSHPSAHTHTPSDTPPQFFPGQPNRGAFQGRASIASPRTPAYVVFNANSTAAALSRFRRKWRETDVSGYQFIAMRQESSHLALFVLYDAKLDKA